ncbi:MAG: hypothetical protein QJR12_17065 [Mycobacterium sp.]|uniref:hypothetical protein n=1 Tax=Mycobacterium sp. TaxID=1785 RepID=UPI002609614F|nr:hypothetical protein [Mycobacterium sp.]MDI3315919.1 hypothetical protein [Mycobacterium sp.]
MKTTPSTAADPRFGVVWGLGCFAGAGLFTWEFFRTTDPGLRLVMPVGVLGALAAGIAAIVRRNRMRAPTTTSYPRSTIALSLFPIGLAAVELWFFSRSADIFYLLVALPIFGIGIWGLVVGITELRRHRT